MISESVQSAFINSEDLLTEKRIANKHTCMVVSAFMKSIKYTRHAKNRMRQHKISEQEIELALHKPEHTEPSTEGRSNIWIKTTGKYLRVTFKEQSDKLLVITAVKKKKRWR